MIGASIEKRVDGTGEAVECERAEREGVRGAGGAPSSYADLVVFAAAESEACSPGVGPCDVASRDGTFADGRGGRPDSRADRQSH